jgi:hypothetical protein
VFMKSADGKAGSYGDKEDQELSAVKGHSRYDDDKAKTNCKQESSSIKAMKQCGKAAMAAGELE